MKLPITDEWECRPQRFRHFRRLVDSLTRARRARADDVDDAGSIASRPEIAVAAGRPGQNVVAARHWTLTGLQRQSCSRVDCNSVKTWNKI